VTERSLRHALRTHGHELSPGALRSVLAAYDTLSTFPDVEPALTALRENPRFQAVVLSNGSPDMLQKSIYHSPGLSPYAATFRNVISADEIRRFKPEPALYRHLAKRLDMRGREDRIWLISGNPFDVVGAKAAGLQAAWVNREQGKGWEDQLEDGETGKPTVEVKSLEEVVEKIEAWIHEHSKQ
jgi:2-haloacid dehalogenase